ncbi:hypothetical protein BV898_15394 [Hypsibius exemplaris]|uniref:GDNF/GAS1 domain-containing protein n=1 Tax=Hypsibius exemplaris TaxID=2072580 RepID=A0A9X6NHR1_HYPEX|nr:hypothetical protein BV898_15394 [Hypsibius exemplaris]
MVVSGDVLSVESCKAAQHECQIEHSCGLQYHSVLIRCRPNSETLHGTCSDDCQLALRNLEQGTKEGKIFIHCDCTVSDSHDATYCENHHSLFSCLPINTQANSLEGLEPKPATCNDARRYCENDWICREALHYYEVVCEKGFHDSSPDDCPTERCLDSLRILKRQQYALSLDGCLCDSLAKARLGPVPVAWGNYPRELCNCPKVNGT